MAYERIKIWIDKEQDFVMFKINTNKVIDNDTIYPQTHTFTKYTVDSKGQEILGEEFVIDQFTLKKL
jgi:hypothetical protein